MATTTKQTVVPLWHYVCRECGFSDSDTGYHGQTHMIYCEICLEDQHYVKLKRWRVEDDTVPDERLA